MLNLVAGENVSGFDIKLNYTNPVSFPLITPTNLSYAGNIFGDANANFVSQDCVFGVVDNQCPQPTDYAPGWIHFSALANSGNPVTGPLNALLFSVKFSINQTARGTSIIRVNTADIGNTGSGAFATTQFIPVGVEDAIFSNSGITAFFNYVPTDTPTVVAGHIAYFDASGSFNADNPSVSIKNYTWNFGDGNTTSSVKPSVPHIFRSVGNFNVTLTVTDANGKKGSFHEFVPVGLALGALVLTVYSLQKVLQTGILVQLFNSTVAFPFENATTDSNGEVVFDNLAPDVYTLAFSGQYVKNSTTTETIIAGWTTQASVGIEVDTPVPPAPTPWYGDVVFLAGVGGAVGVFGFGLFWTRARAKNKLRKNKASLKKK